MQSTFPTVDTEVDVILLGIRLLLSVSIGAIVGAVGSLVQFLVNEPSRGIGADLLASITGALLIDVILICFSDPGRFSMFDGAVAATMGGLLGLLAVEVLPRDRA